MTNGEILSTLFIHWDSNETYYMSLHTTQCHRRGLAPHRTSRYDNYGPEFGPSQYLAWSVDSDDRWSDVQSQLSLSLSLSLSDPSPASQFLYSNMHQMTDIVNNLSCLFSTETLLPPHRWNKDDKTVVTFHDLVLMLLKGKQKST